MLKKIKIAMAVGVIILCFLFNSCGTKKTDIQNNVIPKEIYSIIGDSFIIEEPNNDTIRADIYSWDDCDDDLEAHQKTINVDGISYTGEYSGSEIASYYSYISDEYSCGLYDLSFSLRRDTGELCELSYHNIVRFTDPELEKEELSEEELAVVAKQIASQYIENIDEYEQRLSKVSTIRATIDGVNRETPTYRYMFEKRINGYISTDCIRVTITSKGTLHSMRIGDVGAFSNIEIDITSEEMSQYINQEIPQKFEANKRSEFILNQYSIPLQQLAIEPSGEIVLLTHVEGIGYKENEGQPIETMTVLKTVLMQKDKS